MGGKVPKSFYTKKLEVPENGPKKEYTTAVVKKSEKLTLDFIVAEEGCFLRYIRVYFYSFLSVPVWIQGVLVRIKHI